MPSIADDDIDASAKDVEDLLTEVEDLNFSEEKREDKPKKDKKKKVKAKGMGPPSMGPPPNMGPPGGAPGLAPAKMPGVSGGGRYGASAGAKDASGYGGGGGLSGGLDLQDADDDEFGSGYGGAQAPPEAKQVDVRPSNGGESPQAKANGGGFGGGGGGGGGANGGALASSSEGLDGELGSAGALGGQSAQSRARVLAQQRELQMKRRQQAMLGTNAMLRSTDLSASSEQHTPAMRQFGVRDSDDGQFSGPGPSRGSYSDTVHGSTDSLGSSGGRSAYAQPEPAYAAAAPSATAAAPRPYLPGDAAASGYGPGPGGYPYGAPGGGSTYEGNYDGGPGAGGVPPPRRAPPVTASGHEEDDGYNAYAPPSPGSVYGAPPSPAHGRPTAAPQGPYGPYGPVPAGGGYDPSGYGQGSGRLYGLGGPPQGLYGAPPNPYGPAALQGYAPAGAPAPGRRNPPGEGYGAGVDDSGQPSSDPHVDPRGQGYGQGGPYGYAPPGPYGYAPGQGYGQPPPGQGYGQAPGPYGQGAPHGPGQYHPHYGQGPPQGHYQGQGYGGPGGYGAPGPYGQAPNPYGPGGYGGPGGGPGGGPAREGGDPYGQPDGAKSGDERQGGAGERPGAEWPGSGPGGPGKAEPRGEPLRGEVRGQAKADDDPARGKDEEEARRVKAERSGKERSDKGPSKNGAAAAEAAWDVRSLRLEQAANLKAFLMRPVPQEAGTLLCSIRRNKSTFRKMFPTYRLYMKMPDGADLFLMVSKKRSGQKTSNYLISMSEDDLARKSPNYLGKLRANFVGTEFRVYDNGSNPDDIDNDDEDEKGASSEARQELGVVLYESNVMGARGPRKMQVGLPRVEKSSDRLSVFKPGAGSKDSMMAKFKKQDFKDLICAYNKPPRWNDTVGAFVLNFNGRVTMASVKNFQLITHEDLDTVILQFGRVAKDEFTMDVRWPMSPFQAFAITLSSFDSKIACD